MRVVLFRLHDRLNALNFTHYKCMCCCYLLSVSVCVGLLSFSDCYALRKIEAFFSTDLSFNATLCLSIQLMEMDRKGHVFSKLTKITQSKSQVKN